MTSLSGSSSRPCQRPIMGGDGLAQLRQAHHRRVLVPAVDHRLGGLAAHVLGAGVVGEALAEIDRAGLARQPRHHLEHARLEIGEDRVHGLALARRKGAITLPRQGARFPVGLRRIEARPLKRGRPSIDQNQPGRRPASRPIRPLAASAGCWSGPKLPRRTVNRPCDARHSAFPAGFQRTFVRTSAASARSRAASRGRRRWSGGPADKAAARAERPPAAPGAIGAPSPGRSPRGRSRPSGGSRAGRRRGARARPCRRRPSPSRSVCGTSPIWRRSSSRMLVSPGV